MINNTSLQKWNRLAQKQLDHQFLNEIEAGKNETYSLALQLVTRFDDARLAIIYKTEEIVPKKSKSRRIKVLLLFKNPHPGSVDAGLLFAANHSKTFWEPFFDASYNEKLHPLLASKNSWIDDIGKALTSGNYACPFLYYFKCLYPFPTSQFAHLTNLFSRAPLTRSKEAGD